MVTKIKCRFSCTILSVLFIAIILYSGCYLWYGEDLLSRDFYGDNYYTYSPIKDTFNTKDTLWLHFSFPNRLVSKAFDVTLEKDSFECKLFPCLYEKKTLNDSVFYNNTSIIDEYTLIIKKGSKVINANRYYFIQNQNKQYVFEFGFVLEKTGKFIVGEFLEAENFRVSIGNVPGLGHNSEGDGGATFYSTFQSTGKGYFQFEVIDRK